MLGDKLLGDQTREVRRQIVTKLDERVWGTNCSEARQERLGEKLLGDQTREVG